MKLLPLYLLSSLAAVALGQSPATPPPKNPFAGFGNTGLDRRPSGPPVPGQPGKASATPAPVATPTGTGIALAKEWAGHVAQSSGGQTMKLADLRALLAGFGKAEADTAAHPDVTVYDGQRMDGAPGENCRIGYLMPLPQAEALLFKSRGIATAMKAVAPGLPDGLVLHTYDVRAGIYNRVCIVTDDAKPQPQVVSMVLKAEGVNYYPPTPFRKIERDWHTFDYVNTQNRGQGGIQIDTRVNNNLQTGRNIVVNATGRILPMLDEIPPPGIVLKPAKASPKETMTWYVPEPLIKLMLYCLSKQMGQ